MHASANDMDKTKLLIAGGLAAATLGGVALSIQSEPVSLDTSTATHIEWSKPTTDADWAEDVKVENFDIKSTGVLEEMVQSHTEKLDKEIKANKKYQECPDCIYYDFYQQFLDNGMDYKTAQDEAHKAAATTIAQHQWEVEKLQQSIERMDHEIDLRGKGFVVTDDSPVVPEETLILGSVHEPIVRHIQD